MAELDPKPGLNLCQRDPRGATRGSHLFSAGPQYPGPVGVHSGWSAATAAREAVLLEAVPVPSPPGVRGIIAYLNLRLPHDNLTVLIHGFGSRRCHRKDGALSSHGHGPRAGPLPCSGVLHRFPTGTASIQAVAASPPYAGLCRGVLTLHSGSVHERARALPVPHGPSHSSTENASPRC